MKNAPVINFVHDRAAQQRRNQWLLAALGLVFGVQLGLTAWRVQGLQSAEQSLNVQQQKLAGQNVSNNTQALTPEQRRAIAQTQQMFNSMMVPWDAMLQGIEAARPAAVVMDALQPNAQEGSIKITANAPDFYTMAEFVQRLQQQAIFQSVTLESEALPESGAGNLRAVIQAQWRSTP